MIDDSVFSSVVVVAVVAVVAVVVAVVAVVAVAEAAVAAPSPQLSPRVVGLRSLVCRASSAAIAPIPAAPPGLLLEPTLLVPLLSRGCSGVAATIVTELTGLAPAAASSPASNAPCRTTAAALAVKGCSSEVGAVQL